MVEVLGPLAYRGKKGCRSLICTRRSITAPIEDDPECYGWHCAYCDAPCGSQGHSNCEVGKTMLAESKKVLDERR